MMLLVLYLGIVLVFFVSSMAVILFSPIFKREIGSFWYYVFYTNMTALILICAVFYFKKSEMAPEYDLQRFQAFYTEIMEKGRSIDAAYKPFSKALSEKKLKAAVRVGKQIHRNLAKDWGALNDVSVPLLTDKEAEKAIKEAKVIIASAYLDKIRILDTVLSLTPQPIESSLESIEEVSFKAEKYQENLSLGMALLKGIRHKLSESDDESVRMDEGDVQAAITRISLTASLDRD